MFELFSRLARVQRRLKRVERRIVYQEGLLSSRRIDRLNVLKTYNEYIRRDITKTQALFVAYARKYPKGSVQYTQSIEVDASMKTSLKDIDDIAHELEKSEQDIRTINDRQFVDAWFKDIGRSYQRLYAKMQFVSNAIISLRSNESRPAAAEVTAGENRAAEYLHRGAILTKLSELESLATKCGYTIQHAGSHNIVFDSSGRKITEIPRHRTVDRNTAKGIMKAMAKGEFVGKKTA